MPTIPPGVTPIDLSTFAGRSQAAQASRGLNVTPATNPTYFSPSQNKTPPNGQPINPSSQSLAPVQPNANIGQRAFGPLPPLTPRYLPTDPEGTGPRQYQYPMGANILITPRSEYPELIPFEQLWNIATMYDVAAMCINTRVEETQGFEHSIVAKDKRKQAMYQSLCEEVDEFFKRPDGFTPFESWIGSIIREHLITDAITVFPHLDRGGRLYAAELVDGSCYSDDTEVLTKEGWKLFKDVDIEKDLFATRNQATKEFEWHKATYYHEAESTGDMYHFKTRTLDLLVTSNHRMLIDSLPRKLGGSRYRERGEAIITAEDLHKCKTGSTAIPSTSVWVGTEIKNFVISKTTPRSSEFVFNGDDFAAFMGMWLAEGCWTNGDQVMVTHQPVSKGYKDFKKLLTRIFGKEPCYTGKSWVIGNKAMHDYLSQFGKALEKFVPQEIMDATPRQLKIFWHYFMLGDGHFAKDGRERISTSSKRMADQLQEVAQKIGLSASIIVRIRTEDVVIKQTGQIIKAENTAPNYMVSLHATKKQLVKSSSKKAYTGKVYCVSVPNEVLYVRRNGQPAWCGNTIKPLLDDRGRTLAYQQIVYGIPFSDYKRPYTDREDEQFPTFSNHELLYLPRFTSTKYPYGSPPSEGVILRVNQAIRKQISDLSYFSSGNIPDMLATLGDGQQYTPEQVEEFEIWFNSILEGNDAERRKLRFIPNAVDVKELRPFTYETTLDEWMLRITCAAFAVPPTELGFTEDANRASSETQAIVNERRGIRPMARWLKVALIDELIHNWLGRSRNNASVSVPNQPTKPVDAAYKEIAWAWKFGDKEDASTQSQTDRNYVEMGVLSKDEVRAMRFANEVKGPAPSEASAGANGDGTDTGMGATGGGEAPTGPEAGGSGAEAATGEAELPAAESSQAETNAEEVPPAPAPRGQAQPQAAKPRPAKARAASNGKYPIEMERYPEANGQLFQGRRHETSEFPIVIYPNLTERYPALARFQQDEMAKSAKKKGEKITADDLDPLQRPWTEQLIYYALTRNMERYARRMASLAARSGASASQLWNWFSQDLWNTLKTEIQRIIEEQVKAFPDALKADIDVPDLRQGLEKAIDPFLGDAVKLSKSILTDTLTKGAGMAGVDAEALDELVAHIATFAENLPVAVTLDQVNGRITKWDQNSLAAKLGFGKTLLFPPKHINCRCKIRPLRLSPEQVQALARKTGYLNEDEDGNFYYAARADMRKDLVLMPGHTNRPDASAADYERRIRMVEDKATQQRIDAEYTAQEARRKKWREAKQRQRAAARASADWRTAQATTTPDQEAQAELAAQAEKDWQRQDDKAMQARIAQARAEEEQRIKDKLAEWRQNREAQFARDAAERKAKVEATAGCWIAIWHTDFTDACVQEMRMPWGETVAGCRALKGICVTEGPYLGHMVGVSGPSV